MFAEYIEALEAAVSEVNHNPSDIDNVIRRYDLSETAFRRAMKKRVKFPEIYYILLVAAEEYEYDVMLALKIYRALERVGYFDVYASDLLDAVYIIEYTRDSDLLDIPNIGPTSLELLRIAFS